MPFANGFSSTFSSFIDTNKEVADALATNKPIVALESTIITHGMPYPDNIHTAKDVEQIVRKEVRTFLASLLFAPDYNFNYFPAIYPGHYCTDQWPHQSGFGRQGLGDSGEGQRPLEDLAA